MCQKLRLTLRPFRQRLPCGWGVAVCVQEVLEGGRLAAWSRLRTVCIGCIRGIDRCAVGNDLRCRVFWVRVIVRETHDHHHVEIEAEHVRADWRNGHLVNCRRRDDLCLYGRRGNGVHVFSKSPLDWIEQERPGH